MLPQRTAQLCLFVLLILFGHALYAQGVVVNSDEYKGDIRGIVSDSTTGERLIGVNVAVKGTNRGAATNVQGFYLIAGVPAGPCEVVASAVGYVRRTFKVTVKDGEIVTLNIRLVTRVIESKEIVVRPEGISRLTERSASVRVLTPQQIQNLPSTGQQDLLRSLQLLPGITSTSDVSAKFYVRGGAGDQNLILLDGMKIYNPYHAFGLFSTLDPDIVKSAEVYTGAFPAGYGNRLSSVVSVTTRDGNHSKVSGTANLNFLSGKLELDGPVSDDNTWLVSGRSSLFSNTINRMIPNPAPMTFSDLFFKGTFGTSTGRIGLRGYMSNDDVIPAALDQPNHAWRNSAFSGVVSALMTDRLYMDVALNYSSSEVKRTAKPGSAVVPASSKLEEISLRGELTSFTEGQTTFFEGFEFTFPQIENHLFSSTLIPLNVKDSEVEWYVWSRVEGTTGPLRFDLGVHTDLMLLLGTKPFWDGFQPRLTLSYDLDGNWVAKVSYGIFTQKMIMASNEDDLISLFDAWLYLPADLRPEVAQHYVFALEGNLLTSLAASLQVYKKDYSALTVYNPSKIFPTDPDYINGTGLAYGAEALLRFSSSLVDLYGSYAWSYVALTQDYLGTYAPRYDRRHAVKTMATFHVMEDLDAVVRWDYGSGYPYTQGAGFYDRLSLSDIGRDPFPSGGTTLIRSLGAKNAARLPAYHRLDLGVNYKVGFGGFRGTLGVSLINIYNQKNILYYDRNTGKTDYMIPFFPTASLSVEF